MFNKIGSRGFRPFKKAKHIEIQITPFVDVVLVLLIIFMITSPAVLSGIKIDLPTGSEQPKTDSDVDFLTITINKDGSLYCSDDKTTIPTLINSVKNKIGNNFNKQIFVRGDREMKYGDIMYIIDILNRAGYKKAILITNNSQNQV